MIYILSILLFLFLTLTSALPEPTPAPHLIKRGEAHISRTSKCHGEEQTKTLFGPYTLKYPVPGLEETDTFYAVEVDVEGGDERGGKMVELNVHGANDLPLMGNEGGVGGQVLGLGLGGGEKTRTLSWGGGGGWGSWGTPCPTVTKKIAPGQAGFPTARPVWPKKVFGYDVKPGAVAEDAPVRTKA